MVECVAVVAPLVIVDAPLVRTAVRADITAELWLGINALELLVTPE